jgi:peptide-methionine (S)-S-oxide reductase
MPGWSQQVGVTDSTEVGSSTDRGLAGEPPAETATATFGMGCFWGPDARFGATEGVLRTCVGYAGGTKRDPSYHALGDHTEVVWIEYDPSACTYDDLLDIFWDHHNWAFSPPKRQYRPVVLARDEEQFAAAQNRKEAIAERTGQTVETAIERLDRFWRAEPYHQKYELRSIPVVADELEASHGSDFVDTTIAARLNALVAGHGTADQHRQWLAAVELPQTAVLELERLC